MLFKISYEKVLSFDILFIIHIEMHCLLFILVRGIMNGVEVIERNLLSSKARYSSERVII